jgi:hypothetical protein
MPCAVFYNRFLVEIVRGTRLRMTELERDEQLLHVEPAVGVGEGGVQRLEVLRVDVVEDERGGTAVGVADDIEQGDNVGPAHEVLQDLDFPLDFALLDWLKHLDDAKLRVARVVPLEHLAVLAAPNFLDHLVVLLRTPADLRNVSTRNRRNAGCKRASLGAARNPSTRDPFFGSRLQKHGRWNGGLGK